VKDIEGRFATMDEQVGMNEKENLKIMIQETINMTIWEFQIKHHVPAANHAKVVGHGAAAMSGGIANAKKEIWDTMWAIPIT
jgi:hypothetical protein